MEKKDLVPGKTYTSSRTENDYFFVGSGPDGKAWFTREGVDRPVTLLGSEFLSEKRVPKERHEIGGCFFDTRQEAEEYCENWSIEVASIVKYKEVIG